MADRGGPQISMPSMTRRALAGGAFLHATGMASLARAAQQTIEPPAIIPMPQELVVTPGLLGTVGATQDLAGRIIAPVYINGKGPFKFFVDTGANRSALSAALAAKVGAVPEGQDIVHGVGGTRMAQMVRVDSIRSGAFEMRNRLIPILGDDLIVPADGMLGVDGFAGLRLEFDNTYRTMNVRRSSRGWDTGFTLRADLKFGQLVSAPARIGDLQLPVVFDTGAEVGLANNALRAALTSPSRRNSFNGSRLSNAAAPVFVDNAVIIPRIKLQDCTLNNAVAVVGDFHIFDIWGLLERPALIIGMGVLGSLKSFAVDYGRKELQLRP